MASEEEKPLRATGRCLCGAITLEIRGPLRDVVVCHCGQCRRQHGAPPSYTAAAWSDVTLPARRTCPGINPRRRPGAASAGICGTSLFWEPMGSGRVSIAAGCLDKPTDLRTVRHIFVADKGDFYEIKDGLEQLPHSMRAVAR